MARPKHELQFSRLRLRPQSEPALNRDKSRMRLMNDGVQPGFAPAREGVVVPHAPTGSQRLLAWMVFFVERLVTGSLRCQWRDRSGLQVPQDSRPVIFCLWHNRLAISMVVHRRHPRKLAALVSASKDGALLAAVLDRFGVHQGPRLQQPPRSASVVGADQPGGNGIRLGGHPGRPQGPSLCGPGRRHRLGAGHWLPIVPVTCKTRWKLTLKSWDRFQIPLRLSTCELLLHTPIRVAREAGRVEREQRRQGLEASLSPIV